MGARTRAQLADALAGLDVDARAAEVAALEAAVPAAEVAGTRYAAPLMADARQRAVSATMYASTDRARLALPARPISLDRGRYKSYI